MAVIGQRMTDAGGGVIINISSIGAIRARKNIITYAAAKAGLNAMTEAFADAYGPGTLDWLWAAAEEAQVPVALLCTDSLADVGRIAERYPGLRLTVDHLGGRGGFETRKDAAAMTHLPDLLKLARHPNVAVKATGAPGYASGGYPYASMQPYLRQIFDAFGPPACFGAPTSPRCRVPGSSA